MGMVDVTSLMDVDKTIVSIGFSGILVKITVKKRR
jgi:hypothetical protein